MSDILKILINREMPKHLAEVMLHHMRIAPESIDKNGIAKGFACDNKEWIRGIDFNKVTL
jgi:hypothetical protein